MTREGNIKKTCQAKAEGVKAQLKTGWVAFKGWIILQGLKVCPVIEWKLWISLQEFVQK